MSKWGALLAGLVAGALIALICAYGEVFAAAGSIGVLLDPTFRVVVVGVFYAPWPFIVATAVLSGLVLVALDRISRPFRAVAFAALSGTTLVAFLGATIVSAGWGIPVGSLSGTWWQLVCSAAGWSPLLVFTALGAGYASVRPRARLRRVDSLPARTFAMPKWVALLAGLVAGPLIALICAYGGVLAAGASNGALLNPALRIVAEGSYAVWPFVVATAVLSGLVLVALDRISRPFRAVAFAALSGTTLVAFLGATIVTAGLRIPVGWSFVGPWWEQVCSAASWSPLLVFTALAAGYASARSLVLLRRVYPVAAPVAAEEH
jgi:hypothetical protein